MKMRAKCRCGGEDGRIETKSGQDCVYCETCNKYQYCAPRTETGREVRTVQTTHKNIKPNQRTRILDRANGRCEICGHGPETGAILDVGHIVSVDCGHKHGLSDLEINSDENLIAECKQCNLGRGKNPMPAKLLVRIVMMRNKVGGGSNSGYEF